MLFIHFNGCVCLLVSNHNIIIDHQQIVVSEGYTTSSIFWNECNQNLKNPVDVLCYQKLVNIIYLQNDWYIQIIICTLYKTQQYNYILFTLDA